MAVKINIPQAQQNTSVGRRLFSMAAPLVGGAVGGPAGAAIGSMLGSKMAGGSTQDALMAGAESAISKGISGNKETPISAENMNLSQGLQKPSLGDSAFGRRMSYLGDDPKVGIAEGLNALSQYPPDHPLRKMYAEPLIKAQYLSGGK